MSMPTTCDVITLPAIDGSDTSPRQIGSPQRTSGSERIQGRNTRGSVLPPLPQLPSPLGRSSSPRHHHHPSCPNHRQNHADSSTFLASCARRTPSNSAAAHASPSQHRRTTASSFWQTHLVSSDLDAPTEWGDDTVFDDLTANDVAQAGLSNSLGDDEDEILSFLADNELSSPSSYPAFTNRTPSQGSQLNLASSNVHVTNSNLESSASPRRPTSWNRSFAAPSRSITQLTTSSTGDSQHSSNLSSHDLFGDDILPESPQSSLSSSSEVMPHSLQEQACLAVENGTAVSQHEVLSNKRHRRVSRIALPEPQPSIVRTTPLKAKMERRISLDDDDPFRDGSVEDTDGNAAKADNLTTIDLTEANEVPEELMKPEKDDRIKISAFQCVICMDDVTTLTVTHCGHLYCAQCLHSSLHVEATKGKCPMCRSKIDMKPRASYNTKTKGFWPLQLKLMTSTRKGKRKAENMS